MREAQIVKTIIDYLNSQPHCVAEKIQGSAAGSGKADINACYYGRALRIEVKTADHGNRASEKQLVNMQRWEQAGAICLVAYSLSDVKKCILDLFLT